MGCEAGGLAPGLERGKGPRGPGPWKGLTWRGALPPTLQVSKRRLRAGKGNLPQAWRAGLRAPGKPVLRAHCWKSCHRGCPPYPNCVTSLGAGGVETGLPSTCRARGPSVHLHAADRSRLPVRGRPRPGLGRGLRSSCCLHPPSANPRPPAEPAAPPAPSAPRCGQQQRERHLPASPSPVQLHCGDLVLEAGGRCEGSAVPRSGEVTAPVLPGGRLAP